MQRQKYLKHLICLKCGTYFCRILYFTIKYKDIKEISFFQQYLIREFFRNLLYIQCKFIISGFTSICATNVQDVLYHGYPQFPTICSSKHRLSLYISLLRTIYINYLDKLVDLSFFLLPSICLISVKFSRNSLLILSKHLQLCRSNVSVLISFSL